LSPSTFAKTVRWCLKTTHIQITNPRRRGETSVDEQTDADGKKDVPVTNTNLQSIQANYLRQNGDGSLGARPVITNSCYSADR
jgi:hypothetical protein